MKMAGSQFACQTKSSSILKKLEKTTEKQKHIRNYTDLLECLENMGDWKEIKP